MTKTYEEHREEFAALQRELNALDNNTELSFEEYQTRHDSITERRIAWHDQDKNY